MTSHSWLRLHEGAHHKVQSIMIPIGLGHLIYHYLELPTLEVGFNDYNHIKLQMYTLGIREDYY